jgi:hypothetical protein
MGAGDAFLSWMTAVAAVIVVPWIAFAVASLFAGFPRLRIQQVLGIIGVFAWVFTVIAYDGSPVGMSLLVTFSALVILVSFAGMWAQEFRLLMLRRADEFPDRYDKLAWIFLLMAMAPAGVWLFRSYRRARWPESSQFVPRHPLDESDADVDTPEMQRIRA